MLKDMLKKSLVTTHFLLFLALSMLQTNLHHLLGKSICP